MGQTLTENQVNEILANCSAFVERRLHPFNPTNEESREVYAQLATDSDFPYDSNIEIDLYTFNYINYLYDCALTNGGNHFFEPLIFSYRFTANSIDNSEIKEKINSISQETNGWFKVTLYPSNANISDHLTGELNLMCGVSSSDVICLASPVALDEDDKQKISKVTSFVDDIGNTAPPFEYWIDSCSSGKAEYNIDLYRVGNANTSVVTHSLNKESLIIDCGRERNSNYSSKYSASEREIQTLNPEYIVISHNHIDHFNLLYINASVLAINFGIGISSLKKIYMVENNITGHPSHFSLSLLKAHFGAKLTIIPFMALDGASFISALPEVKMHMGTCNNPSLCVYPYPSYQENDSGLIISISNMKRIIFAGDCSYEFFPPNVRLNSANYIVVPHHGGKVVLPPSATHTAVSEPTAFISSGYRTFYHGPKLIPAYDQESFLMGIGITSHKFLESISGTKYSLTV